MTRIPLVLLASLVLLLPVVAQARVELPAVRAAREVAAAAEKASAPQADARPAEPPATPAAQAPAASAAAPSSTPPSAVEAPRPEPPGYNAGGRRDPFVSLLVRAAEARPTRSPAEGLAGALITEITLKGIVTNGDKYMAMLQTTDGKTYLARPGEQLRDGTIKIISVDTVVFLQQVRDPLSPVQQREVRRSLRTTEDVQ